MSNATLIALQAAQIARLREALRQILPLARFHDAEHPGIAVAEKLLKERIPK